MLWRTGHQGNPKPPPCFPLTLILASSRMIRRDLVKGELLCRAGTPAEATLATAPRLTLTLICGACAQAVFIILEGQFAVRRDPGRGSRDSTPSGRGLSWGVEVALLLGDRLRVQTSGSFSSTFRVSSAPLGIG